MRGDKESTWKWWSRLRSLGLMGDSRGIKPERWECTGCVWIGNFKGSRGSEQVRMEEVCACLVALREFWGELTGDWADWGSV